MLFWIICAAMTFAAVMAMLLPYWRDKGAQSDASDLEVYKDQLKEIDVDEKRNLISRDEAEKARIEVGRRILKADKIKVISNESVQRPISNFVLTSAVLALPVLSWGSYAYLGSPHLRDQPILARSNITPVDESLSTLVAKAEAHLETNPNDGKGWEVLAPIYLRMSRYEDSIRAFEKAGKLNGPSATYEIGVGHALTAMNGGVANDAARAAFERASAIDPNNPEPKLFLAANLAEQGRFNEAKAAYENLLASAPKDAPWRALLVDMIARIDQAIAATVASQGPNPTQTDVEQASGMSEADRNSMIEGMVSTLSQKLESNPSDVEGWKRLLRSYSVLNKPEKLKETYERAKIGLKDNPSALTEINALATQLSIVKP